MVSSTRGEESEPSTPSSIQWSQPCRPIEFPEILTATKNFDESLVIGRGGFGKVYKGNVNNGAGLVVAAIKRLDPESSQGPNEFWAEIKMLCMLRHRNIVSLIGYCIHEQEKILIYEYMPNGTLDDHLHKRGTRLSWLRRLNICVGAARGLRYLHNDVEIDSGVIHRDFKSSNILLHESWTAKVSDFGLSKTCPTNKPSTHVCTLIKGSFGYLDPNYYETGKLTRKSDVYAFGVVLLEVLCRKRALDERLYGEGRNLVAWARDYLKERNLNPIIDSNIKIEISPKCLKELVKIVERCVQNSPQERPTMAEVFVSLENALALQEKFHMQEARSRTIFGRMVDMFPFPSNRENSVQGDSKLPSNSKGYNGTTSSTARVVNMFPQIKVQGDSKLLRNNKGYNGTASGTSTPRAVNMFSQMEDDPTDFQSPCYVEVQGDSKLSSNSKGYYGTASGTSTERAVNMFPHLEDDPEDFGSPFCVEVQGDSKLSSNRKGFYGTTSSTASAVNMFPQMKGDPAYIPSPFYVEGDSKLPRSSKGNDKLTEMKDVHADFQIIANPSVKGLYFADLEKATRNFSPDLLLGEKGLGKVFLGWVDQKTLAPSKQGAGIAVAVKRLNQKGFQGHIEWLTEANFLEQLAHPNIIRLLGYCRAPEEHLLVYEYMSYKSFDRFLFTDGADYIAEPLSWGTRLLIMIRVARGLAYLHMKNIIHRALKPSSILLDEGFNAKIGNFGLVKYGHETEETHFTTRIRGTPGYMDPEYLKTSHLSTKSDIYSFGVVLLESISGRRAIDVNRPERQQSLVQWATHVKSNNINVKEIMDQRLEGNYPLQGGFELFALASTCVERKPKDRPSVEEVLKTLEQIYGLHK